MTIVILVFHLVQHLPRDAVPLHQAPDAVVYRAEVLVNERLQLLSLCDWIVLLWAV